MPIVGNRKNTQLGQGYINDPIAPYAEAFLNLAQNILNEDAVDLYLEPKKAMMQRDSLDSIKNFFVEGSYDPKEFANNPNGLEDHIEMMTEQFANDRDALLEHTPVGDSNPVIGMTFPIHKNILMNNVFDKGGIPKYVTQSPKFTVSMETRMLVAPDGTEIDMFREQNKMTAAINSTAPMTKVELALPHQEDATDIVAAVGGTSADKLSISTYVSDVQVNVYLEVGDKNPETGAVVEAAGAVDVWLPANMKFNTAYGEYDRTLMDKFTVTCKQDKSAGGDGSDIKTVTMSDTIAGYIAKNSKVFLTSSTGFIKKVKLNARLDTSSAMLKTCSVRWSTRNDLLEVDSAIPINTTISPEEVKDIGALYQVNQLSKVMSMFKLALANYKDDTIKTKLDESFVNISATDKFASTFDFAPREGYALDHVEWRYKTFMDWVDTDVTHLLQVLNDPNMTVSIFGRPDLIRKITPTEYSYQTPSNIGPVELDFTKTVTTSDKRIYQFMATDKLRDNNNLIVILCPRNTDRFIYRIYDYQMYVSNEIRNVENYALPAVHAFERWLFSEYQPVQGRIKILNPRGLTSEVENDDPIGHSDMNDYTADKTYHPHA